MCGQSVSRVKYIPKKEGDCGDYAIIIIKYSTSGILVWYKVSHKCMYAVSRIDW